MNVVLCLVFFVSGAAALLFETLWFRQAGLMFGNSVWASSLVMASFMAGLALGNALAARYGRRSQRPLLAYATLEAATSATGVGLVLLFPTLTGLLAPVFRTLLEQPARLNGVRLALAFALMLIPATAMGATLPLLARVLGREDENFGRVLGRLYGWNTLGAVAGALAGESLLIPQLGIRGTGFLAGGLDACAALVAAAAARRWRPEAAPQDDPGPFSRRSVAPLLAAAFLSGGILLALEVVWFRFLLLFVYGRSPAFGVMLAVVLLGIAGGGLAAARLLQTRLDPRGALPLLALAAGLCTALGYVAFAEVVGAGAWVAGLWDVFWLSLPLMLPASLLSGGIFTCLGKALKEELRDEARTAGWLTLANTLGAMLGALVGGFVLLPRVGMENSFFALAGAYLVVALLSFPSVPWRSPEARSRELAAPGLLAACLAAVLAFFPFGLMRNHYIRLVASRYMAVGTRIEAIREGLTETIVYVRKELGGQPVYHQLLTNGFSMSATNYIGLRYMRLFVYWPVALHPDLRRALLISYGVGSTAKALTDTASLESIDVVDISRDVLEASRVVFPPPERHPLDDPRVRAHVEDGRFFLLTTDRRYDLITAEPPPPGQAGVVNLYSREYFHLLHDRLAEGGMATYWLPVNQLDPRDAKAVISGFCDAFEDCSLWTGFGFEWVLAGTRNARGPVSEEQFTRQWRDPTVARAMREIGLDLPEQLGALFIADARSLRELTAGAPPLDDDHPGRLSYHMGGLLPSDGASYVAFMEPHLARKRFLESDLVRRLWPESLRARSLAAFEGQAAIDRLSCAVYGAGHAGLPELEALLTGTSLRAPALWLMGSSDVEQQIVARAVRGGTVDPSLEQWLGVAAMADRSYLEAEQHLERAPKGANAEQILQWRILALALAGQNRKAAALMAEAAGAVRPQDPTGWAWLARTYGLPYPFGAPPAAAAPGGPSADIGFDLFAVRPLP